MDMESTNMIRQAAALPMRSGRVCLIMSSSGKRWVIPKGCIERGSTLVETALQEAWEEAGLMGHTQREPVGSFLYRKGEQVCHVTVFLMEVTEISEVWPEKNRRMRRWLRPEKALSRVKDPGLRKLIRLVLADQSQDQQGQPHIPLCWKLVPASPLQADLFPVPYAFSPRDKRRYGQQ